MQVCVQEDKQTAMWNRDVFWIDGEPAQMGQKVHAGQDIRVDGKRVSVSRKQIVLAVNKPKRPLSVRQRSERKIISLILLATLRGFTGGTTG